MSSDPFHSDETTSLLEGVVPIHDVTSGMMDVAARKAAEAADRIAHRSAAAAGRAGDGPTASAGAAVEQAGVATDAASAVVDEAGRDAPSADTETMAVPGREVDHAAPRGLQADEHAVGQIGRGADRTCDAVGNGLSGPADAVVRYNAKLLEILQANVTAAGDLCAALMSAKSVPEIVALNADHVRRQMDVMTMQGRDLASLAQQFALDALQPIGAAVASRFRAH